MTNLDTGTQRSFHTIQKYSWLVVITGLAGIFIFLFFDPGKEPNPNLPPAPNTTPPAATKSKAPVDSAKKAKASPDSI